VSVIVDVVLPIFALIFLGYGAARFRLFDEAATRGLSLFVFNFAIPVLLVRTMSRIELPSRGDLGLLIIYFGTTFIVFALGARRARHWRRGGADPAIFGITGRRSASSACSAPCRRPSGSPSSRTRSTRSWLWLCCPSSPFRP
jgi:predicted permease